MYSIGKYNNDMCRSRRKAAEFMQIAGCGNAAKKDTKKCWNNWIIGLNGIKLAAIKIRIPLMCW
jgi:hypothetical protein